MHATARRLALLAITLTLLASALAGCIGATDTPPGDGAHGAGPHLPTAADAEAAAPFSIFLCKDGYHVAGHVTRYVDNCNHRVTKPLKNASWLNVVEQHGPGNEVSIAVNPENPLQAAGGAKDYTVSYVSDVGECGEYTVWMGTFHTTDGGLTWGNDLMPGFPGDTRESPLSGNECNTDPVLVWDDDGTLWYSGLNYEGAREDASTSESPFGPSDAYSGSQLYFAKSTDGGASYGDISFAAFGDDSTVFNDKQWFAAQPGGDHMIATWAQFLIAPGGAFATDVIAYAESLDGGATWSQQKVLRPGGDAGGVGVPAAGQFSMPQYLPASQVGDIAVIWWDGDKVLYAEAALTPGGAEFGPVQSTFPVNSIESGPNRDGTGPTKHRISTYPVLAVDTSGGECDGRRYVVWADQEGGLDSDVEVLLRYSDDGRAWSDPVTVNDESAGDQYMPWIDVDPAGGVHVAWYDKRHDDANFLMDTYYAYSGDCGESFHPNVRVTEKSFNGDLAHHQTGAPFVGDYIGLDTTAESAHVFWADTRHTGSQGRLAGSDVYAATILKDMGARTTFDAAFE